MILVYPSTPLTPLPPPTDSATSRRCTCCRTCRQHVLFLCSFPPVVRVAPLLRCSFEALHRFHLGRTVGCILNTCAYVSSAAMLLHAYSVFWLTLHLFQPLTSVTSLIISSFASAGPLPRGPSQRCHCHCFPSPAAQLPLVRAFWAMLNLCVFTVLCQNPYLNSRFCRRIAASQVPLGLAFFFLRLRKSVCRRITFPSPAGTGLSFRLRRNVS